LEKESLGTQKAIDINYFKDISDQIAELRLVEAKKTNNTQMIANIIKSYEEMLKNGTDFLIEKINARDTFITSKLIQTYFGDNEILQPYLNQVNEALAKANQASQERVEDIEAQLREGTMDKEQLSAQKSSLLPSISQEKYNELIKIATAKGKKLTTKPLQNVKQQNEIEPTTEPGNPELVKKTQAPTSQQPPVPTSKPQPIPEPQPNWLTTIINRAASAWGTVKNTFWSFFGYR
jgi:hypothetical protein